LSNPITKPSADSHAARLPVQPSVFLANIANEYTAPVSTAMKTLGSCNDTACQFELLGDNASACAAQTIPTTTPINQAAMDAAKLNRVYLAVFMSMASPDYIVQK
jgi:hypothetical protein